MRIGLFCLLSSLLFITFFDFQALVAPVMKMLVYCKLFFIKTIPAWIAVLVTGVKKGLAKLWLIVGSWEAWSAKKLFRHGVRFVISLSARIVVLNLLINLFFSRERKGIKNIPRYVIVRLRDSWLGRIVDWWNNSSERTRRISTGVVLCLILIAVGQAFIGISILVFDLVWECVIALSRFAASAWRWLYPIIARFIPNVIGSFFTNKVLPFFTNAIPYLRNDHRIIYVRTSFRERFREYKKRLLKFGRAKRPAVRARIRPLVSAGIRTRKKALIEKAASVAKEEK